MLAFLTAKLRLGTLDELRTALEEAGLDEPAAAEIGAKLSARGLNDIGSIKALFHQDGWSPRIAPTWRLAAAEARRRSVGLTVDEHTRLVAALAGFPRVAAGPPS